MKVLVTDSLSDLAIQEMKQAGLDITVKTGLKPDALREIIPPFHILAVRSGTKVTAPVIEAAKNLKLIVRAGVGLDNIDVEAARKKGIQIENTPFATTVSVAEHTFALMLGLVRHIPQAYNSLRRGEWDRKTFQGNELKGKTLGVVGLGRIGQEVAKRAKAFGMHVIATDNTVDPEVAEALEIELIPLEELVSQCDIITIHLPLTNETKHLFNRSLFRKMKLGVRLINASRGGIVEETALVEALEEGHVAGAAMDVFESEPPQNSPLVKMNQVVAVPHLGAATNEGQMRAGHEAARIIIEFSKNG